MDSNQVVTSYSAVAEAYALQFFGELEAKPMDRALLDLFVSDVRGCGLVADLGCGPGHVARYLNERGIDAIGVDLSPAMIAVAQRLSPGVRFDVGSMLALQFGDGALGGAAAFYAIVNLTSVEIERAFVEIHRVLAAGAPLLFSFHLAASAEDERHHVDDLLGSAVALDFFFYPRPFIENALRAAGFVLDAWIERRPVPSEHPSTRAYVFARKPGA